MIWFTSDLHFYHQNVIRYCDRPYTTVEEMNEDLIRRWNAVVRPGDTVFCLGDLSMAARPVELFSSRLMGDKVLIPGNHDFCHSAHKKSRNKENQDKWIRFYESHGWKVGAEQVLLELPGIANFLLCHLPYSGDHTDMGERYADKRPRDEGRWLLCGHVHNHWKIKGKMINVGVDVWGMQPVALDQIMALMREYPDGSDTQVQPS